MNWRNKTFDFIFEIVWVLHLRNAEICHSVVFFIWNCSESPFLEVCKLTDLMAVKVGRFTDLGAVLVEYYRAKSSNGLNMQGLTHVLGKSKFLIRDYKEEDSPTWWLFSIATVVFARVGNIQRNDQRTFAEAMQFIVQTHWFVLFWQDQLDGTNEFSHSNDSRMIRFDSKYLSLDIIKVLKQH